MIKWEPARSSNWVWSLGPQCIMEYTHHVYSHRIRGQENIVLAACLGTSDCWRLGHHLDHYNTASAHMWSHHITSSTELTLVISHGVTGASLLSLVSPWIFMCVVFSPLMLAPGLVTGDWGLVFTPGSKAQAGPDPALLTPRARVTWSVSAVWAFLLRVFRISWVANCYQGREICVWM